MSVPGALQGSRDDAYGLWIQRYAKGILQGFVDSAP
jgi:hypothetical protein